MNHYVFEDLTLGLEHFFDVTITAAMLERFYDISGDSNPLHIDSAYAKAKGFPDQVVYGMLTASFYSTLVGVHLPGKNALLYGVNTTFHQPVFIGDILTVHGIVHHVHEDYKLIEIKAFIVNQHKKKVSKAKIKVGLHE